MSLLEMHDVSAGWGGCPVLEGVNAAINAGQILGLLGPNGAGKSTLLGAIVSDTPLLNGTILFDGRALAHWAQMERARRVAFLPQASSLAFPFTVAEVVLLGRLPHGAGQTADHAILQAALEWTDTTHLVERIYTLLSGGEQQRVQLARVLCQLIRTDPKEALDGQLLLLDEPSSALDLAHRKLLVNTLRYLASRGCTVLVSLHDINLMSSLVDLILVLNNGHCQALDTPHRLLTSTFMTDLYGTGLAVQPHPTKGYPLVFDD